MLNNVTYKVSEFRSDFPAFPKKKKNSVSSLSIGFKFYPASTSFSNESSSKSGWQNSDAGISSSSLCACILGNFLINSAHLITSNWPIKVGAPTVCSNHLWQEEKVSPSLSFSLFIHCLTLFTCLKCIFHFMPQLSFVTPAACGARLKALGWMGQARSPLPGTRSHVNDQDGPGAATQTRSRGET